MYPLMRQINITYRCGVLYRERQLADLGLNGYQPPYLSTLYRTPGISQEELARRMNLNKSSVARQLAALESAGYVRREADPADRRSLLVYPTEKALAVQERIGQTMRSWRQYLTQDFTPEEQEALSRLLTRVAERAERYVKGDDAPCGSSANI